MPALRIDAHREYDRNACGRRPGRACRARFASARDHRHPAADHIAQQRWQPIILVLHPTDLDRNVPALDEARFLQALAKRDCRMCRSRCRAFMEKPDYWHRLLHTRGKRPNDRRAPEQRYEPAPPHSIASFTNEKIIYVCTL